MTEKRFVPAMVFLLLNAPVIFAQTKIYTVTDIWQRVLHYYPSLTAKKDAIEIQTLQKGLIRQSFLPDVYMQAQYSYGSAQNIPGSFFALPGIYTTGGSNKTTAEKTTGANLFTSATLQWNFLQFGRKQKRLDAAEAAITISRNLLQQEEWTLLTVATRLYFSVVATMAALDVAKADTRRLSELLELLQSQVNAGLRPGADTLLLKSSLLQSQAKAHDFSTIFKTKLAQLGALIGDTSSTFSIDTTVFTRFQPGSAGLKKSLQNHPFMQTMNARIWSAEAEKKVIKKELYPSVGLLAGVGIKGSGVGTDGFVDKGFAVPWQNASGTYLVGLGLTWNFTSLYQNKTKRAAADREIAMAEAEKETVQIQLQTQYAAAIAGLDEQHKKLAAALAARSASREAYGLYEVRYQSGLLSLIELLQLQKNLQEVEIDYVTAVSTYWNELLNQVESLGDPSLILTVIKS